MYGQVCLSMYAINVHFTVGGDYLEPSGDYEIPGGQRRACLSLTLLADDLFEDTEQLSGLLQGILDDEGALIENPPRVNFDPDATTVEITDNDGMT